MHTSLIEQSTYEIIFLVSSISYGNCFGTFCAYHNLKLSSSHNFKLLENNTGKSFLFKELQYISFEQTKHIKLFTVKQKHKQF